MRKADHTTRQQLQAGRLIQDGHILPSRERALVRTGCIVEVTGGAELPVAEPGAGGNGGRGYIFHPGSAGI